MLSTPCFHTIPKTNLPKIAKTRVLKRFYGLHAVPKPTCGSLSQFARMDNIKSNAICTRIFLEQHWFLRRSIILLSWWFGIAGELETASVLLKRHGWAILITIQVRVMWKFWMVFKTFFRQMSVLRPKTFLAACWMPINAANWTKRQTWACTP